MFFTKGIVHMTALCGESCFCRSCQCSIHTCQSTYWHAHTYQNACMSVYILTYTYIPVCMYVSVHTDIHTYQYACMPVYTQQSIHICLHTHTHTCTNHKHSVTQRPLNRCVSKAFSEHQRAFRGRLQPCPCCTRTEKHQDGQ